MIVVVEDCNFEAQQTKQHVQIFFRSKRITETEDMEMDILLSVNFYYISK